VEKFDVKSSPKVEKILAAPAADEGPCALPGCPDAADDVKPFQPGSPVKTPQKSPEVIVPPPKQEVRAGSDNAKAGLKARPGSAGGARPGSADNNRPSSAGGARPGSSADDAKSKKDRPGSADRNRDAKVKPQVWLTDRSKLNVSSLQDAEKNLDKDIFKKKASPKKQKKKKEAAKEDPGPLRPTTAKRRENRPGSAEKNRGESVKPSVWLENVSRESKAGTRSLIDCTAKPNDNRPSSADRNRRKEPQKDNNGATLDQNGKLAPLKGPKKSLKISRTMSR